MRRLGHWLALRWAVFRGRARIVRVVAVFGDTLYFDDGSKERLPASGSGYLFLIGQRLVIWGGP